MSSIYFIESITEDGGGQIGLTHIQIILLLLLLVAVFTDFIYEKIFNGWIVTGILIGFFFRIIQNGWQGIGYAIATMLLSFVLLYPLYKIGALGAGDVKLFLMTGSFVGMNRQLPMMGISFLAGALFSIGKMISEENFKERMQYLFSYLLDVLRTGQWKLYGENLKQDDQKYNSNKIHFALPVCISVMLGLGGLY
ncbi:MAG: A24 family peptidase [Lachnospiraceae bacterium]|nr:A24 family peptidase [Lachnospiraceae bacterium]